MNFNSDEFLNPNFKLLSEEFSDFKKFVFINKYGGYSINWKNPNALRELVKTLLNKYLNIIYYEIPENYLIPTLTSRYNYLNYINKVFKKKKIDKGENKILVDIGTGANIIYPLLGYKIFNWKFIGSEINDEAINIGRKILKENNLENDILIIKQNNNKKIFENIINFKNKYFCSICNPPFFDINHEEKKDNLFTDNEYNYNEVYCEGGEIFFIKEMIKESYLFRNNIFLFSTLIGRKNNMKKIYSVIQKLKDIKFLEKKTIQQGNNSRYIIIWSFYDDYINFKKEINVENNTLNNLIDNNYIEEF